MLKCVPFLPELIEKDVHAIYRRPSGDLTSGLPMRRHHQWDRKGFTYVTLADPDALAVAAPFLRARNLNPQDYIAGAINGSPTPWNVQAYLAGVEVEQAETDAELTALIAEHGVETVEKIRGIRVPDRLKPGYVAPAAVVAASTQPEQKKRAPFRAEKALA